eukprot:TRINITY_DN6283_c0_g2_i1.p1 TRINITY_DN6283_c0_g2~~TRINITY_DN6283_c0_g2_i1.p1  ORF type:complete len:256 (-),score=36.48 TRINITY_DN6283_c0_g2_i1:2-769(-)
MRGTRVLVLMLWATCFFDSRFFSKGGDSGFHKTRTGMLPASTLGIAVFANSQGGFFEEAYVAGIRNALLQIFSGVSDDVVEKNWRVIAEQIANTTTQLPDLYPEKNITIPLQDGVAPLVVPYRTGPTLGELDVVLAITASAGMPPPNGTQYEGTYSSDAYGDAVITRAEGGQLYMKYGTVEGVLSWLSTSPDGDNFAWPNMTRSTIQVGSPIEVATIRSGKVIDLGGGVSFSRNSAYSSRGSKMKKTMSPYLGCI